MIRENQRYLNKLQILLDLAVIILSFLIAYLIRFYLFQGVQSLPLGHTFAPIGLIIPLYFILYTLFDLYGSRRVRPLHTEINIILKTHSIAFLVLILVLFVFKVMNFSRAVLFMFLVLNFCGTVGMRVIIRMFLKKYRRKGYNLKHCLVVGTSSTTESLLRKIKKNPHWGYNVVGIVASNEYALQKLLLDIPLSFSEVCATCESTATEYLLDEEAYPMIFDEYKLLGSTDNLPKLLEKFYIDIVMIAVDGSELDNFGNILHICEKAGVKTNIIPYYHKYIPAKPYMDDLDGIPIIDTRHVPLDNPFKDFMKRIFDILFALVAITLTSPLLLLSAIMVKITSPGPIIFKQERVGLGRKNFYMYKFRSMKMQTEEDEKDKWTTPNDPRKTRWGTFMRKTSIDELPQFFNVLKGDMSVVGPRPERPFFVEKFKEEVPRYMIKHQVRPGITGWAQINGFRGDTSIEGRIEHDLYYIENWAFGFDLKIIFLTVFKGFVNKNAY